MKIRTIIAILVILCLGIGLPVFAGGIHDAARQGDIERVKSILASDASQLNAEDYIGHTPLTLSAAYAHWDLLQFLLEAGADVNHITRTRATVMHCASCHDRPDMVALLFEKGGASCLTVKDVFGEYTPMLRAVQRGSKNVIALLFEKGARPDEATKEGWNALHLAAKCGHRQLYELLIEKGVSLVALDQDGNTPMAYDFRRPDPIPMDPGAYDEFVGFYTWHGAPEGLGVTIFLHEDGLMLDDNGLDRIYPIAEDTFYCSHNPWQVKFFRDETDVVHRVELTFLRRSVMLNKVPTSSSIP